MIKVGEVAFLKTTDEPVFVLEINDAGEQGFFPQVATVRRPVQGDSGVHHDSENFYAIELESLEEKKARFKAERDEFRKLAEGRESQEDFNLPN